MRIFAVAAALVALLAASVSPAQPAGGEVEIIMSSFKFEPAMIHLRQNAPYVLVLRNASHGGHSFAAGEFFATAEMPASDRARLEGGKIEVPGGQEVRLAVIPNRPGLYRFRCTHPLHSTFGMHGSIVVE